MSIRCLSTSAPIETVVYWIVASRPTAPTAVVSAFVLGLQRWTVSNVSCAASAATISIRLWMNGARAPSPRASDGPAPASTKEAALSRSAAISV